MNPEQKIREIVHQEIERNKDRLHNRIQDQLVSLGSKLGFMAYKEYLHVNPFQKRRGLIDVYWESRRANYAIEIDTSLRKKSLQKLISLQAVAQPIWILLSSQPEEMQQNFLKENDCFSFVHVIAMNMSNKSNFIEVSEEPKDFIDIDENALRASISEAVSWTALERNLQGLNFSIKPRGGGLVFFTEGMSIKASSLGQKFGFNDLCKRLGAPPEHLTPSSYTVALGMPKSKKENAAG